jgi:hypothetical protein
MAQAETKTQALLATVAVVLLIALSVLGLIWYGFSAEVHQRIWRDIFDRPGGPMMFRFILQPVMAFIAALHDGIKDARTGRSPYFWTVLTDAAKRGGRLREGLISTGRIILLGRQGRRVRYHPREHEAGLAGGIQWPHCGSC